MRSIDLAPNPASGPSTRRSRRSQLVRSLGTRSRSGQATVEFALVSLAFMMIVLGTVDFGRAIFMYSQLHNAVREGARYGKINPAQTSGIKGVVIDKASSLDIDASDILVTCEGGCSTSSAEVTVRAHASFQAVFQELLGIAPIEFNSTATVETE